MMFAKDGGDPGEIKAAKAKWFDMARLLMRKRKGEKDLPSAPPQKARKKSFHWCVNLNSTVQCLAGHGLDKYFLSPDAAERGPAELWPYLSVACDQGPDSVCSSYFLANHCNANVQFFWDPAHGYHRDILLSTNAVKLGPFTHLMTIAYNLGHSPWDSHDRYSQMIETMQTYLEDSVVLRSKLLAPSAA